MTRTDHFAKSSWMLTLVSLAVVVAVLHLAKGVFVPLMLAVLLSFLLVPGCDWLERRRVGRPPAVCVTVFLAFSALGAGAWTAADQMIDLAPKIPEYQSNIKTKLLSINKYLETALSRIRRSAQDMGESRPQSDTTDGPFLPGEQPAPVRVISSPPSPVQVIGAMFGSMVVVVGSTGLVIILVVFILIRREDLRDRFILLIGHGQLTLTTQALEDAASRVSRFLLMQLFINITFGVPIGIGLYFIGVPNAVLWGIVATFLRFIPYIGAWSAAAAPIGLSLAISTDWLAPLLTVGLFVVLELFVNNVMEPWIYGKNTGVSSVAILVAAVFWTWLWGPVGLLLATPLTVCLLVIGKHVPQLSFLDILLGNEQVFDPQTRVYQRLLAGDQEEAAELALNELEHKPLVEVYDAVLVPALAMAEIHWHRGDLDEIRHSFICQSVRASIEELGERWQAMHTNEDADAAGIGVSDVRPSVPTDSAEICVLCLPAHDEADEIAGLMLAQVLEGTGCTVHSVSVTALVGEMVDLVEQRKVDVVCISSTPPAAVMHARYLCKRLRGRFPEAELVVGLWNAQGDLDKAKDRIGCGAATHVVGTLADAQEHVRQLTQSLLLCSKRPIRSAHVPLVLEKAII
ncbi:MAG: AI-2E family transporter [Phycisphaerales bacterium]|nr:AI-2E family transporter [Phycisphaerales bacterium]